MATSVFIAALALLHAAPAGILAYVSGTEQQDQQIHLLDLGTGESRAVGAGSHDNAPAWSPDGTRIAYHSKTDDGLVIRVVTADGSERSEEHTSELQSRLGKIEISYAVLWL